MEYTVDTLEKGAISQIAHTKFLGQILHTVLSSAPPVVGVAPVRVDVHDAEADSTIQSEEKLSVGVYDDIDLTIPSIDTALNTATEGAILLGAGTNLLMIKTSATGGFACSATCGSAGVTRYLATSAGAVPGSGIMDCRKIRTLIFP